MKKKNIIALIILGIIAISAGIGYSFTHSEELATFENFNNYQQCLYGCPSSKKRKKRAKKTEATNFKREYIILK